MLKLSNFAREKLTEWLRQGISPRRLALTLALGFSMGCLPIMGVPTALCILLAFGLHLNLPVLQAANWAAIPAQIALVLPFVRIGNWLLAPFTRHELAGQTLTGQALTGHGLVAPSAIAAAHPSAMSFSLLLGSLLSHAVLAWIVLLGPAVAVLTLVLWFFLQRIPLTTAVPSAD